MTNFAQRFRFGLPVTATLEDKRNFITFRFAVYCRKKRTRDTHSEYFADSFQHFIAEDIKIANPEDLLKLRDLLRGRCVHVSQERSVLILDAPYAVVGEDLPWPENELEDVSITDKSITGTTAENDIKSYVQESVHGKKTILTETWTRDGNLSSLM